MELRLNKYISESGSLSRRSADHAIEQKRVSVNGVIVTKLGTKVNPDSDIVLLDGKKLIPQEEFVYYLVNKPIGYICTLSDPKGRKKITDLVPERPKVYPAGRLDSDSRGLVLLTNDGKLTYAVTHPKHEKQKKYRVVVTTPHTITAQMLVNTLKNGVVLKEGRAKFDSLAHEKSHSNVHTFVVTMHQGWNRQIRRMFATAGGEVIDLQRTHIGGLSLKGIEEGTYRSIDTVNIYEKLGIKPYIV